MTGFARAEWCDVGRVYSSVMGVDVSQGLVQCDYSSLVEIIYKCLMR